VVPVQVGVVAQLAEAPVPSEHSQPYTAVAEAPETSGALSTAIVCMSVVSVGIGIHKPASVSRALQFVRLIIGASEIRYAQHQRQQHRHKKGCFNQAGTRSDPAKPRIRTFM